MTDSIHRKGIKFLLVGGANTAFVYSLFVALGLFIPSGTAYTIAFLAGLVWVMFGTSRVVFGAKSVPRMVAFGSLYLAVYITGRLIVHFLHPTGAVALMVTSLVLIAVTVPISFVGGLYIFRHQPVPETR